MYVDKRLAGIQAVQTLSRLNRAHPGKDTTYVLDFVNGAEEVLAAFKTYYDTAELEGVTDPNLVFDLRAKLDAAGHYDDFEVDRVVAVELNPKAKQSDLVAALEPVVDRLLKRYKEAQEKLRRARAKKDDKAAEEANGEMNALVLFKADMGAFQRLYTFLSQIFDYGNTAIEKRFIFYRRLLPLLEFGREREGIDLSKVVLTHHNLKDQGKRQLPLGDGEAPKLAPLTEAGSGSRAGEGEGAAGRDHREGERSVRGRPDRRGQARLREQRHQGEAAGVAKSWSAGEQQHQGAVRQLADLSKEIMNAIMDALEAHTTMSKQAIDSERCAKGSRMCCSDRRSSMRR